MTGTTVALLSLVLQAAPQPPLPQSPADCVKAGREFAARRMKELGAPTTGNVRTLTDERLAMLRACSAQFDVDRTPTSALPPLVELYIETEQSDLALRAIDRGLRDGTLTPAQKGLFLTLAIRQLLRQPKSAERNAAAEKFVAQLDALGSEALEQQIAAHGSLNSYYRADDIDSGIIKHSTWLIDTGAKLSPELRKKFGGSIVNAYGPLAQALCGQGETDRAIALLNRARSDWPEVVDSARRISDTLARALMVGKAAPPVSAPVWLNRTETAPLAVQGKVTLLQFTAHWCGPCKESYPGMKRLEERFAKDGLQVVFYTRTYGHFESEQNLSPAQEIERDKGYFARYQFTLPIAVGAPSSTEDAVENAYEVTGIPQINLIDKKGNIRLVMIGYDDENEEKLASFIKRLLDEKQD